MNLTVQAIRPIQYKRFGQTSDKLPDLEKRWVLYLPNETIPPNNAHPETFPFNVDGYRFAKTGAAVLLHVAQTPNIAIEQLKPQVNRYCHDQFGFKTDSGSREIDTMAQELLAAGFLEATNQPERLIKNTYRATALGNQLAQKLRITMEGEA